MPGYHRAEVTAELKIIPSPGAERSPRLQIEAASRAAGESGLAAHEAGPDSTILSGGREEVLETVKKVIGAALDAGAHAVEVRVVAEGDAARFGG